MSQSIGEMVWRWGWNRIFGHDVGSRGKQVEMRLYNFAFLLKMNSSSGGKNMT
jgi:hypothetical protein